MSHADMHPQCADNHEQLQMGDEGVIDMSGGPAPGDPPVSQARL